MLKQPTPYPGLAPGKSRRAHTTEQKLVDIGQLITMWLYPFLKDETCFDSFLDFSGCEDHECEEGSGLQERVWPRPVVKTLEGLKYLSGALLRPHAKEYFIVSRVMKEPTGSAASPQDNARISAVFAKMAGVNDWGKLSKTIQQFCVSK